MYFKEAEEVEEDMFYVNRRDVYFLLFIFGGGGEEVKG